MNKLWKRSAASGMGRVVVLLGWVVLAGTPVAAHAELSDEEIGAFFSYMVKIKSEDSFGDDKLGFGVIMLEKDDFLYIATPKHVVVDEDSPGEPALDNILVTLRYADRPMQAVLLEKHPRNDLALLRVPRPEWFEWFTAIGPVSVSRNTSITMLGFEWDWAPKPLARDAVVTGFDGNEIEIDTPAHVNMSGGLVVTGKGIAGMIIESSEDRRQTIALGMEYITRVVLERWLRTNVEELVLPKTYPRFSIDLSGDISILLTSMGESNPGFTYGPGLGVDYIISPRLGLRYSFFDGRLSSDSKFDLTDQSSSYRNEFNIHMLYLLFNFQKDLTLLSSIHRFHEQVFGYIGVGIGEHDPQLDINHAGSRSLDSYSRFQGDYDERFHLLSIGARFEEPINRYLNWGFDVGLTFADTEYLGVDVDDPFEKNDVYDFFMDMRVFVSIPLGREPRPVLKALF